MTDRDGSPLVGSISEKAYVEIGGVRQGMFIEGRDAANPVLLYLHGGMADHFLTERYPTGLEDEFVVCWWEQRGTGISYDPKAPKNAVTAERLIADTLELTDHLRRRFGRERIYLMGHSGGTFFGIRAAARAPERYHAYVGVAQMADQLASEREAYEYMLARYRELGDDRMVRKLQAAPVTAEGMPREYLFVRDTAMHRLGVGTTRDMRSILTGIVLPQLMSRDYTLAEKARTWRAKANAGVSILWDEIMTTNLTEKLPGVPLPVYFLQGAHDRTCCYDTAKAYLDRLEAPVKGFYTFEESAHSPMFEEPGKTMRILREDVLCGRSALADAPTTE